MKKIDEIKVDLKRSYVVARVIYGYIIGMADIK